jgi:hypothetical protein
MRKRRKGKYVHPQANMTKQACYKEMRREVRKTGRQEGRK